jgi:1-acylglycerone phosphate reductase
MAAAKRTNVLVTGCSEGGIGWHLCVAFAAAGCHVFGTARRLESMRGLEEHGVVCLALDVTSEQSIKTAVAAVLAQAERIDIVVNNAGCVAPRLSPVAVSSPPSLLRAPPCC